MYYAAGMVFLISIICLGRGYHIGQESEAYDAVSWLFGGVIAFLIGAFLIILKIFVFK